jgi:hypothetical protein
VRVFAAVKRNAALPDALFTRFCPQRPSPAIAMRNILFSFDLGQEGRDEIARPFGACRRQALTFRG